MIADLNQPAKHWLADHIENFGKALAAGEDPSCMVHLWNRISVEVRLVELPGHFKRDVYDMDQQEGGQG